MATWTIGIDPGQTGAIAVLDDTDQLAYVDDMPYAGGLVVATELADMIRKYAHRLDPADSMTVWVEQAQSMPNQSGPATFKYGAGYGVILGVLGALGVRTKHIRPHIWKRGMGLSKDKGASRRLATELWPYSSPSFARVKDDGRAEAALIAHYGLLQQRQGLA